MKWQSRQDKEKLRRVHEWHALARTDTRFSAELAHAAAETELKIEGQIFKPGDDGYDEQCKLDNPKFDIRPKLIACCESVSDVRHCLAFAHAQGLSVAARSGGHNTAGFCLNGDFVIDLKRMIHVIVDPVSERVRVGPGARMAHLNDVLDLYGLHVPSGGCRGVHVPGFVQGGGYGYTSRMFGMNCDNLVEATVVLADGSVVVASDEVNCDLFWALRGGTGGNFGVMVDAVYRLRPLGEMIGFRIWWPLDGAADIAAAAAVLDHLQTHRMGSEKHAHLGYQAFICWQETTGQPDEPPRIMRGWYLLVRGMCLGSEADFDQVVAPLHQIARPFQEMRLRGTYRQIDIFTHQNPSVPQVDDAASEDKQSGYIARALGVAGWRNVIARFLTNQPNYWSLFGIESYGGAINSVPVDATAFIHRNVDMDVYVDVFWMEPEQKEPAIAFLDDFMQFMERNYFNGRSFQNYPREVQTDYRKRYWGESFYTLRAIKLKYDPRDFFNFPQAVVASKEYPDPPDPKRILAGLRKCIAAAIKVQVPATR